METGGSNNDLRAKIATFRFMHFVLQIIGIFIIALTFSWVFFCLGGLSWSSTPSIQFNWHPLLMTIGMIYLYGNSILIYRGFRHSRKKNLKLAHASIFGTIMLFIVIASWAVYDSHVLAKPPIPNLYSLHSWIGLAAMILFGLQWIGGFFSFLYPLISAPQREAIMPLHIYFGLTGYILAVAAALLGLSEKAFFHVKNISQLPMEGALINSIGILIAVFGALVVYLASHKDYKRLPLPEDAVLLTRHDEITRLLDERPNDSYDDDDDD